MEVADEAVLGDREVALRVLGRSRHGGPGTESRSAAYSCAASSAAPSTPACTPWRASRMLVLVPQPGTACRQAARAAGSSSRLPARETPPPMTTSSGSNDVDGVGDPDAEALAEDAQQVARELVALEGQVDDAR